jgi:hypothetical protein
VNIVDVLAVLMCAGMDAYALAYMLIAYRGGPGYRSGRAGDRLRLTRQQTAIFSLVIIAVSTFALLRRIA